MCLATPLKIKEIIGDKAIVEAPGHTHEVDINLIKDAKIGDYIIAHSDLALNVIPEKEALKILETIKDLPHEH